MDVEEIRQYVKLGNQKSITIDCSIIEEYPHYVRSLTIIEADTVLLEYNYFGMDEGPLRIKLQYMSTPDMITSLEGYLGREIGKWVNCNKTGAYPDKPAMAPSVVDKLHVDVLSKNIPLPRGYVRLTMSGPYADASSL